MIQKMKNPLPFSDELEEVKKKGPKQKLAKDQKASPENCGDCPYYIMDKIPHFTVESAAVILCVTPGTVRNLLSKHKEKMKPPLYRRRGIHPARRRILYSHDIKVLNTVLAKKKYWSNILHAIPKEVTDAQ